MALIKCKECGQQLSDNARVCPHCGAPHPKQSGNGIVKGFFIVVGVLLVLAYLAKDEDGNTQRTAQIDASPAAQQKRLELIDGLIDQGILEKVEVPGTLPYAWTGPRFNALSFDDKQLFLGAVSAYYRAKNPKHDPLVVNDGRTGKQIGKYSTEIGGLVMN